LYLHIEVYEAHGGVIEVGGVAMEGYQRTGGELILLDEIAAEPEETAGSDRLDDLGSGAEKAV